MESNEDFVRNQIQIAMRYMTRTPTEKDIINMMDDSLTDGVDVKSILNEEIQNG